MEVVNLATTEYNSEFKENQFLGLPLRQALKMYCRSPQNILTIPKKVHLIQYFFNLNFLNAFHMTFYLPTGQMTDSNHLPN